MVNSVLSLEASACILAMPQGAQGSYLGLSALLLHLYPLRLPVLWDRNWSLLHNCVCLDAGLGTGAGAAAIILRADETKEEQQGVGSRWLCPLAGPGGRAGCW